MSHPARSKIPEPKEIPIAARFRGPGPSTYQLPSTIGFGSKSKGMTAPAYSFGIKLKEERIAETPGPNQVFPTGTRNGDTRGPSFSLKGGFKKDTEPVVNPGPGQYLPGILSKSPAYSIAARQIQAKPNGNPSPAHYGGYNSSATVPTAAAYSILPLRPIKTEVTSPGPAAYEALSQSKVKRASPSFSLGGRAESGLSERTPGPSNCNLCLYSRFAKPIARARSHSSVFFQGQALGVRALCS